MTDNQQIKAIIFDLGNVLVDFNHLTAAQRISHFCQKSPQEIFELFFDSGLTGDFEAGKISPQDFFLRVKEMLDLKLPFDSFVPIWNDIFFLSAKNRAIYSLANRLKEKYQLILLSNINVLHYEYLKKYFPVFNVFHRVVTSFEIGYTKPHPQVYQKLLQDLGVLPEEVFYTDDRIELVEGARKLGIRSFLFKDIAHLRRDLAGQGVSTP